jgi:endonuclease/exonuclease/phosphatase family metal-dependent hydrolase
MAGSCCGGGCCRPRSPQNDPEHGHPPDRKPTAAAWLTLTAGLVVGAIIVASAIAFVRPSDAAEAPPAAPPAPTAPAKPAPAKTADPAPKAEAPAPMQGVIRHGRKDPIPKPAGAVRVVTYNVENFFDHELPADEGGEGTPVKPASHRKAVAEAIKRLDADVIALEEIESKETLTRFRDDYLRGLGYDHVASLDAGDPRGIEQAVLSRFPLKGEQVWHNLPLDGKQPDKLGKKPNPKAGQPMVLKRSPLRVDVQVPAERTASGAPVTMTLFVVHHKSGPYYGFMREAEAAKVAALANDVQKERAGAPVLILGDFNARPREASVQTYISAGFTDAFGDLVGTGANEPPEFVTHVSGRAIDHILLSPAAAPALVKDTRFILGTIQRPDGVDWRRTDPPEGYGSDHYPVVIDLRLGATSTPTPAPAAPQPTPADSKPTR